MDRRKAMTAIGAAATAALAAPASAQPTTIRWRVPTSVPEGSPLYVNFLQRFASHAKLLTGGRVEIQPFGAGVIVPALQVYDAVQQGTIEAGHSTPGFLVNKNPVNAIFTAIPGGMGPTAFSAWIYEGGGLDLLRRDRKAMGLHSLVVGIGTTEIMAHANKPIRTLEDLKGIKYRTSAGWAEVMKQFGATPVVVPPAEIFTLLQRRGVDAIEWANPSANLPEGFHQAARFIVVPGVHQPSFLWEVFVREETWSKVPEDIRMLLEVAAKLTTLEGIASFMHADMLAMNDYRKGNNEIVSLAADARAQLEKAGRVWAQKIADQRKAAGDGFMADVLRSYTEYQDRWRASSGFLIQD